MRMIQAALILTMLCIPSIVYAGQSPTSEATAAPLAPSERLKPSLDMLQQTVGELRLEKWKGGTVRQEAASNIQSVQHDLQANLPSLLADADATPRSLRSALPLLRNLNALYDVVLRVNEAARVSAPREQIELLGQAMASLDGARRTLADNAQEMAVAQEKRLADQQRALRAQAAPPSPVVCAPVEPPPARVAPKKKRKVVPKAAPAAKATPAPAATK